MKSSAKVHLLKVNSLVTDVKVPAKTFNKFFVNAAATLGLKYEKLPFNYDDSNCNLDELIVIYNDHPSILAINNKYTKLFSFHF